MVSDKLYVCNVPGIVLLAGSAHRAYVICRIRIYPPDKLSENWWLFGECEMQNDDTICSVVPQWYQRMYDAKHAYDPHLWLIGTFLEEVFRQEIVRFAVDWPYTFFFCGTRRADACSAVCLSQRRAPTPTNCFSVASFFNKLACYFCMLCSVCLVLIAFNYVSKAKEVSFLHKLHLHSSPLRCHDCA